MSDEQKTAQEHAPDPGALEESAAAQEQPTQTPFDHPMFLPAILMGLTLWFGYDGFINQDPEMLEHLSFNRGGFALLSLATAWFGYKGWREMRDIRAEQAERPTGPPGEGPPPPIA